MPSVPSIFAGHIGGHAFERKSPGLLANAPRGGTVCTDRWAELGGQVPGLREHRQIVLAAGDLPVKFADRLGGVLDGRKLTGSQVTTEFVCAVEDRPAQFEL